MPVLREVISTAFRAVPERIGRPVLRGNRRHFSRQLAVVDGPSARRDLEHGDRPPREPHATILAPHQIPRQPTARAAVSNGCARAWKRTKPLPLAYSGGTS